MPRRRSWGRVVVGLLVLAVVGTLVASATSLRACIGDVHGGSSDLWTRLVADIACFETYLRERVAALIALFTIILGLGMWFLWLATRDVLAQNEQRLQTELRAYMTFHEGRMLVTPTGVRFEAVFVNSGKTPAHNVHSVDSCDILPKGGQLRPITEPGDPPESVVVGPGQPFHLSLLKQCTEPTSRLVESGQALGYVWGRLNYTDSFGEQRFLLYARRGGRRADGKWMLIATGTDKAN